VDIPVQVNPPGWPTFKVRPTRGGIGRILSRTELWEPICQHARPNG